MLTRTRLLGLAAGILGAAWLPAGAQAFSVSKREAGTCVEKNCAYGGSPSAFYTQAAGHPNFGITARRRRGHTTRLPSTSRAAPDSSTFQVGGCGALAFKPSITVSTGGRPIKAGGASLTVKITQGSGQANIREVQLQRPSSCRRARRRCRTRVSRRASKRGRRRAPA
jgi:hypothetical protein